MSAVREQKMGSTASESCRDIQGAYPFCRKKAAVVRTVTPQGFNGVDATAEVAFQRL